MNGKWTIAIVLVAAMALAAASSAALVVAQEKPDWVSTGKYAEYEFYLQTNVPGAPSGTLGTARWEITEVYDDYATVSWQVNVDPQYQQFFPGYIPPGGSETWYYTDDVAGFILGSDALSKLASGQPPSSVPGTVSQESKGTKAGTFDCYKVSASQSTPYGTINLNMWYERETGILVAMSADMDVTYQGQTFHISAGAELTSTNAAQATGGLPGLGGGMMMWIIIAVVIVVVVVVALLALTRRRRPAVAPAPAAPPPPPPPPPPGT